VQDTADSPHSTNFRFGPVFPVSTPENIGCCLKPNVSMQMIELCGQIIGEISITSSAGALTLVYADFHHIPRTKCMAQGVRPINALVDFHLSDHLSQDRSWPVSFMCGSRGFHLLKTFFVSLDRPTGPRRVAAVAAEWLPGESGPFSWTDYRSQR